MASFLRTPHGILLTFGCLLLGVAGFTALDFSRRTQLESIVWPTSAGDTHLFQPQTPLTLSSEMVRQAGLPLRLLRIEPINGNDGKMLPVGKDNTGSFTLYRRKPQSPEESAEQWCYLKIARHKYLLVAPPRH